MESDVDPKRALFINPYIEKIDEYASQLSQPTWLENSNSKIEIEKRDEEEPSPDMYDSTVLAFARDSLYGLKLTKY